MKHSTAAIFAVCVFISILFVISTIHNYDYAISQF